MKIKFIVFFTFLVLSVSNLYAQEPLIGEIKMFAGNFAPRGWALCDGQLLAVSQYSALFSILGTNYGGDGRTTFGLPDLRGRTAVHAGQSSSNINRVRLGQRGGSESTQLREGFIFEDASGKSRKGYTFYKGDSIVINRDPFLGVNYIIALDGKYPSRN
jgi:microcystin-dependent protein